MKKLISIILTACICLSLLGGISFAGAADAAWNTDGVYTYSFVAGTGDCNADLIGTKLWEMTQNYDKSSFYYFDADDILKGYFTAHAAWDKTDTTTVYKCSYENKDYSVNISDSAGRLLCFNSTYFRFKTTKQTLGDGFPADRWVALKLDASNLLEGMYDITVNADTNYIRKCNVYLAPYDENITNTEEYMKTANLLFTNSSNVTVKKVENWKHTSDTTDYIMIIKLTAASELRLKSIVFDRKLDYEIEHDKNEPVAYNLNGDSFNVAAFNSLKTDSEKTYITFGEGENQYLNWNTIYGRESFMDLEETAPWCLDYSYASTSDRLTTGEGSYLRVDFGTDKTFFVVRVYVPNTGTFNVGVNVVKHNSGGVADVYLAKSKGSAYSASDVDSFKTTAPIIGSVDTKSGTGFEKENITLEAGEYAFLFMAPSSGAGRNYISSITLTPVDDAGYTEAFAYNETDSVTTTYTPSVDTVAYAKDGTNLDVSVTNQNNGDGTYTLTAPEYVGDNNEYKFLYWAKGLVSGVKKQVVSTDATYTDYVPQNEANYLIAVYDKAGESGKAEFYNANGQLITTLTENGTAPNLPYMAGYGQADNWALNGTSTKIDGGAEVTLDGYMMFFAEYDTEAPDSFEITVNGNKKSYNYGDLVTCEADENDADGNIFYGWTKTVNGGEAQLVSAEPTYTFRAWEACTVTPVYKKTTAILFDGAKRKILLGTFTLGGEEAVMAEYIGFDGASEKGIILGAQEIAMTSDNNQFTVVNTEKAADISGYAILDGFKYVFDK